MLIHSHGHLCTNNGGGKHIKKQMGEIIKKANQRSRKGKK
jgi:hypothetical protein